jgi:hypothetical protein
MNMPQVKPIPEGMHSVTPEEVQQAAQQSFG